MCVSLITVNYHAIFIIMFLVNFPRVVSPSSSSQSDANSSHLRRVSGEAAMAPPPFLPLGCPSPDVRVPDDAMDENGVVHVNVSAHWLNITEIGADISNSVLLWLKRALERLVASFAVSTADSVRQSFDACVWIQLSYFIHGVPKSRIDEGKARQPLSSSYSCRQEEEDGYCGGVQISHNGHNQPKQDVLT